MNKPPPPTTCESICKSLQEDPESWNISVDYLVHFNAGFRLHMNRVLSDKIGGPCGPRLSFTLWENWRIEKAIRGWIQWKAERDLQKRPKNGRYEPVSDEQLRELHEFHNSCKPKS